MLVHPPCSWALKLLCFLEEMQPSGGGFWAGVRRGLQVATDQKFGMSLKEESARIVQGFLIADTAQQAFARNFNFFFATSQLLRPITSTSLGITAEIGQPLCHSSATLMCWPLCASQCRPNFFFSFHLQVRSVAKLWQSLGHHLHFRKSSWHWQCCHSSYSVLP